jgi:streptogramin lyase
MKFYHLPLLLAFSFGSSLPAAIVTFDSRPAWLAAVTGAVPVDLASQVADGAVLAAGAPVLLPSLQTLVFNEPMAGLQVPTTWETWSGGEEPRVLYVDLQSVVATLSGAVDAFGFEMQPNNLDVFSLTMTLSDGSELQQDVNGDGGAAFFGWVNTGGPGITAMTLTTDDLDGLAVGRMIQGVPAADRIPEPGSSVLLFLLGLAGVAAGRRYSQRSRAAGDRVLASSAGSRWLVLTMSAAAAVAPVAIAAVGPEVCSSKTYTLDEDFDLGTTVNLNHNAPNNNQLQINPPGQAKPFPFVNVACSGRGTMVRIDVNTGQILGEYFTAPSGMGRDPSRTTVDKLGNVWVTNRAEGSFSIDQPRGSVARIGLVIGGTRGDKNMDGSFSPNPAGSYLQGPFSYNTVTDRDGDGLIKTSRGLANILPWSNAGGADSNGGVTTAEDEAIITYTRVAGTGTRTVAVDAFNDVWVGGLGDLDHEKLSGVTGLPVPGTQFNLGAGGYGGLIDGNGVLWSARGGAGLLRFVPNPLPPPAGTGAIIPNFSDGYGLAVDPVSGNIWHTYLNGNQVARIRPDGSPDGVFSHGNYYAQGLAVDGVGNVWVAHSLVDNSTTVGHLRTNGTFVGNVPLPGGSSPTGVAVDANGKVWVTNYATNNVMRIDPAAGPVGGGGFPVGAVDLTVELGAGASPYNYSDMTGAVLLGGTSPSGSWTVVHDGGASGIVWKKLAWTGDTPAGTNIQVKARSANTVTDLPSSLFEEVTNGADLAGTEVGRFIEVQVSLTSDDSAQTPILYDLRISDGVAPIALCQPLKTNSGKPSSYKRLTAMDVCDAPSAIKIYVKDSASPFIAGPFKSGARVAIIKTMGAPSSTPGTGGTAAIVRLNGNADTYGVDSDGNIGPAQTCVIP